MPQGVSVCVFSGHTGGHLFPAFAFAERFKRRNPDSRIYLITSPKARPILAAHQAGVFEGVEFLNEFPLPAGISLRTLHFLLEFARGFFLSSHLLSKMKPDLCIGFGSYVSYPGLRIAAWRKIRVLIHEQNAIAGKATRMLARTADLAVFSFENTQCKPAPQRSEISGLPVRDKLYQAAALFQRRFDPPAAEKPLQILITGGSQGAQRLNEVVLESFSLLSSEERQKIAVKHSTGTKNLEQVTENYRRLGMKFNTFAFYENMQDLYQEADLAITRAGANTLFELALFGVPAIVVPYPHAAENHQEANARCFEVRGAVEMKTEKELTAEWLVSQIRKWQAPEIRKNYSDQIRRIAPQDAAVRLADLAGDLLKEKK